MLTIKARTASGGWQFIEGVQTPRVETLGNFRDQDSLAEWLHEHYGSGPEWPFTDEWWLISERWNHGLDIVVVTYSRDGDRHIAILGTEAYLLTEKGDTFERLR